MSEQGSTGNVVAAVCSFFIPGLGQLVQGRLLAAAFFFLGVTVSWWFMLLIVPIAIAIALHIWCIVDAAVWRGPR